MEIQRVRMVGRQVRDLLTRGLADRRRCDRHGWSRCNSTERAVCRVEVWLQQNPWPSAATLARLLATQWGHIAQMMPYNNAGRKRLREIERLIQSLNQ